MLFKALFVYYGLMTLAMIVNAATQPGSTCFNPKLKSYANVNKFIKEATSKFDKNDLTNQGDARDLAQAFVCANELFKWMRTFGTTYYDLDAYNWTNQVIRIFGRDVTPGSSSRGKVYNDKGYFFWRQAGICYMTKFENNSSLAFAENIMIKDGQKIYGGTRKNSYPRDCAVVQVDNSLCDNYEITYEMEGYVMGKWLTKMKACKTTF